MTKSAPLYEKYIGVFVLKKVSPIVLCISNDPFSSPIALAAFVIEWNSVGSMS